MLQKMKDLWTAFTADPHAMAMKELGVAATEGKVALHEVEAALAKARATLKARQTDYWNALTIAVCAFAAGVYVGHRYW